MRFALVPGAILLVVAASAGGAWWFLAPDAEPPDAPMAALPVPPHPPRIIADATYDACLDLLPEDPTAALALVRAWPSGGAAAAHCQALALIAQGQVSEGATILEALADTPSLAPPAKAVLLDQASEAWLQAGAHEQAYRVTSRAIGIVTDDPDMLLRHARVASLVGRDGDALADLTRALQLSPDRVDALLTRAMVWRRLDRPEQAKGDIDRAVGIAPTDSEVLLERGIQRQQSGDLAGAREDWQRVVDIDPDSQAADLAEQNLALLDAGPMRR